MRVFIFIATLNLLAVLFHKLAGKYDDLETFFDAMAVILVSTVLAVGLLLFGACVFMPYIEG